MDPDIQPATFATDEDATEAWRDAQEAIGRLGALAGSVQESDIADDLRAMAERLAAYFP